MGGDGSHEELEVVREQGGLQRSDLLRKGLLLGGAAAALGGAAPALAAADRASVHEVSLTLEVAILGATYRAIQAPPVPGDEEDIRGTTFSQEGFIYPNGTIKGASFDPYKKDPTGLFLSWGTMLGFGLRQYPAAMSTHLYILGNIRFSRQFPPNQLTSTGLEGTVDETQISPRALTGGTGSYAGVTGVVRQQLIGVNTTDLPGGAAPNYRFEFHFAHD